MTEALWSFDAPDRQATEDRAIIDHLVKTFHADPAQTSKPPRRDDVSSRICRQWNQESRAMLETFYPF